MARRLSCLEHLDDEHTAATARTGARVNARSIAGDAFGIRWLYWRRHSEQISRLGHVAGAAAVRQQPIVPDAVEAAQWYRKSAEQGYVYAQSQLGFMYGNGAGIPRDYVQADLWLNLAAAAGDPDAADYRSFMEQGMTPAELAEARRLFNAWKMKRAGTDQPGY